MDTGDLVERAVRLRTESKTLTFNELGLEVDDPQSLAEVWLSLKEWITAGNQVASLMGVELASMLPGAPVEAFGHLVYYGQRSVEKCIDPQGFHAWLRDNPDVVEAAFNPDSARKGSIPRAVRETFFEKSKKGEAVVQAVPLEVLK